MVKYLRAQIPYIFSKDFAHLMESWAVVTAIAAGFVHALVIILAQQGIIDNDFLVSQNILSAIATPFTIILIYEVLLLVLSVAKSIPASLAKQYEIIALVIIRDVFKLLAEIRIDQDITEQLDLVLAAGADIVFALVIFGLIYLFACARNVIEADFGILEYEAGFMKIKRNLALMLVFVFLFLLGTFFGQLFASSGVAEFITNFKSMDFLTDMFTVMILVDVLILLLTFVRRNDFASIFYEAVLVISSILIRFAFVAATPINGLFAVSGILVGIIVTYMYKRFLGQDEPEYY